MLDKPCPLAELLSQVARGDRTAFRQLFERTAPRQLGIARRILGRADLAEEAVQEAYLTIWNRAADYQNDEGKADAWITTIVRRRAIDRLRASPWLTREVNDSMLAAHQQTTGALSEERLTLEHCLSTLDDDVSKAIRLSYHYGYTHSELSQRLGVPLGTLKSRIRRGLVALKQCLDE